MSNDPKAPLVEPRKPFTHTLAMFEGGQLNDDLSEEIVELNAKLSQYAANHSVARGKLTLEINFKLEEGVMTTVSEIKVKAPKFARKRDTFWLSPGNQLTPENPKQEKMFNGPRAVVDAPARAPAVDPLAAVRKAGE